MSRLSPRTRFLVLRRDGFTCQYCGRRPPEVVLHVDHVQAKSKGGADHLDNFVTACRDCNLGKGTLDIVGSDTGLTSNGVEKPPSDLAGAINTIRRGRGRPLGTTPKLDQAAQWLRSILESGEMPAVVLFEAARGQNLSEDTVRRAQARLHIKPVQRHQRWVWALPSSSCSVIDPPPYRRE